MAGNKYASLKEELNQILDQLQAPGTDIDKSIELYKQGQKLVNELQKYLDNAKNQVKTLDKPQKKE